MTVKELKKKLGKYKDKMEVKIMDGCGNSLDLYNVYSPIDYEDDASDEEERNTVYLET